MNYEKSCGCVVFRKEKELEFLLILNGKQNCDAHWGFPKGHTEGAETEEETARRELFEETGLCMHRFGTFRHAVHYLPRPDTEKDAVYFLSEYDQSPVRLQETEVADFCWCTAEKAASLLPFETDRTLLFAAYEYLTR